MDGWAELPVLAPPPDAAAGRHAPPEREDALKSKLKSIKREHSRAYEAAQQFSHRTLFQLKTSALKRDVERKRLKSRLKQLERQHFDSEVQLRTAIREHSLRPGIPWEKITDTAKRVKAETERLEDLQAVRLGLKAEIEATRHRLDDTEEEILGLKEAIRRRKARIAKHCRSVQRDTQVAEELRRGGDYLKWREKNLRSLSGKQRRMKKAAAAKRRRAEAEAERLARWRAKQQATAKRQEEAKAAREREAAALAERKQRGLARLEVERSMVDSRVAVEDERLLKALALSARKPQPPAAAAGAAAVAAPPTGPRSGRRLRPSSSRSEL
eukprot:PLAT11030.1.p1 GENE.PLAT11030.1~~PLAT11030.1.p1  ORF type:complete len:337 (+),score=70.95 PLAT11030.1:32-1012(+)